MREIDWTPVKTDYVTGTDSLRVIAKRHKVSYTQLSKESAAGGWVKLREQHRAERETEARRLIARAQARELAEHTLRMHAAADELEGVIASLLGRISEAGLTEISGNGTPGRELESISRALDNIDNLKRRLCGAMAPRDEEKLKIDREKLALERKRFEEDKSAPQQVLVRFEGDEFVDGSKSGMRRDDEQKQQ